MNRKLTASFLIALVTLNTAMPVALPEGHADTGT